MPQYTTPAWSALMSSIPMFTNRSPSVGLITCRLIFLSLAASHTIGIRPSGRPIVSWIASLVGSGAASVAGESTLYPWYVYQLLFTTGDCRMCRCPIPGRQCPIGAVNLSPYSEKRITCSLLFRCVATLLSAAAIARQSLWRRYSISCPHSHVLHIWNATRQHVHRTYQVNSRRENWLSL